ncbi:MAG: aldo/keto reductase, partial [Bacteroidota bacterium]
LMQTEGIGLVPWGPLGGGFLTGKYSRGQQGTGRLAHTPDSYEESWQRRDTEQNWQVLDALNDIANAHLATVSQVSIAWLLQQPIIASVLIGVRTLDQLKDNLGAISVQLSDEEVSQLNTLSQLPELYPYRMIEAYAKRSFPNT